MAGNETDLVRTTYLDALVVLQKEKDQKKTELEKIARAEKQARKIVKRLERDEKIVSLYLKSKFPDAFQELGVSALSEKEFPSILKRAKRYFRMLLFKTVGVSSALLGGEIALLAYLLSLSRVFTHFLTIVFLPILTIMSLGLTLIAGAIFTVDCIGALRRGKWSLDSDENGRSTASLGGERGP